MQVADFSRKQLLALAGDSGLKFKIGPFSIELKSDVADFTDLFATIYAPLKLDSTSEIFDFHIQIRQPNGIRRWWRPQVNFFVEGMTLFDPYPRTHAFPLFEWGLNWCIGSTAHQYIMLHSAVLEKNHKALILPAMPGSGKSTLCAALMLRGWRLLSDEFGLIDTKTSDLLPLPRAIPLKNESIEIIRKFDKDAVLGPVFPKTRKGDVAHLAPGASSLEQLEKKASPSLVVFPQYQANVDSQLEKLDKGDAFTRLTKNSFNYYLSQEKGFNTLVNIIQQCDCYSLEFNCLEDAIEVLTKLIDEKVAVKS